MALPNTPMDAVPFTPLTAAFLDNMIANIEALAAGTGMNSQSIGGDKLNTYRVRRRNNTTNTTETAAVIQSGWVAITAGNNSTASASVVFPAAFTGVPVVIAAYGGDTAGATSSLGSGAISVKQAYADATSITTTGFLALAATRDATNWTAGNTVYVQWLAIGV